MNKNNSATGSTEVEVKRIAVPIELKLYALFSIVISFLGILFPVFGPKKVWFRILPFTGWLPAFGYMFTLYFIYALVFKSLGIKPKIVCRDAIVRCLKMICLAGILTGLLHLLFSMGNELENSMLKIIPWQPVWTILLPICWIMILKSPAVNRFCEAANERPLR